MADILPGFTFDLRVARYRDSARGQFVAKDRITDLLKQRVSDSEERLTQIVQGVFAKEIAPGVAQEAMRDEMRRLVLANNALGKGGIDQLDFKDFGRAGNQLRDSYQRMSNLLIDIDAGNVTLPQALRRIEGYTIEARNQFFAAQRAATIATGRQMEERRVLHAKESCSDCIELAALGWQPAGTLPIPGDGSTQCEQYDRCSLESREVETEKELA